MRTLAILGAASVFLIGAQVLAAPSSYVVWSAETIRLLNAASATKGELLAYGCVACHGESGMSASPAFPYITGQDPRYLFKQLSDYKDKTRINPLMNAIAAGMSDEDMADIAAYYAAQPPPAPESSGGDTALAMNLITKGHGSRMVPSCEGCHGHQGAGQPGYYGMPVLGGQKSIYLQIALTEYRSGNRANDVYAVMRNIAKSLTDDEITALGNYYATQQLR